MIRRRSVVALVVAALVLLGSLLVAPLTASAGADTPPARTTLAPGQTLLPGQTLVDDPSEYGLVHHLLVMQDDGNLVEYLQNSTWTSQTEWGRYASWSSHTAGNPGAWANFQTDGNLVVYSAAGRALWNSHTAGHPEADQFTVQPDGNMVIRAHGRPLWGSGVAGPPNSLRGDGWIETLQSANHRYYLGANWNGLTLLDMALAPHDGGEVIWYVTCVTETRHCTDYGRDDPLHLQADGNLVMYMSNPMGGPYVMPGTPAFWSTNTAGTGRNNLLVLQDDGNLVLYGPHGALWSSGTAGL